MSFVKIKGAIINTRNLLYIEKVWEHRVEFVYTNGERQYLYIRLRNVLKALKKQSNSCHLSNQSQKNPK